MGVGADAVAALEAGAGAGAGGGGVSLAAPAAAGVSFSAPSGPGGSTSLSGAGPAPLPQRESLLQGVNSLEHQCTLDEPVSETIMRDLRSISEKLKYVLLPTQGQHSSRLKDWDLWGPLLLCLALGVIIAAQAPSSDQASYAFADVFVIVWLGSSVVTLNALVLRGKVSFFLTVCVLGYCLSPLVIAAFFAMLFKVRLVKLALVAVGFAWASKASVGFMEELVPEDKKLLGLYPVWLFYAAIAWMILII